MLRKDAKDVVRVALPLYLSMAALSLSVLVNTAALGRHDTGALAAFAVMTAISFPVMTAVSAAVRGVLPFAADDPRGAARDGTWLVLIVGLPGAGIVVCAPLLARVTAVGDLGVLPWLLAICVLINGYSAMATSCLVGLGRGKAVLRAGLARAVSVALLSPFLVAWLGLNGAGVSYLIADVIGCVVTIHGLREHLSRPRGVHFGHLMKIAKVGIPMAGTVLVKFAVLGVLTFAAALVSEEATAAHSIANTLVGFAFTAAVSIGQGTVPMISSGTTEVRRAIRAGLLVAVVALSVVCALIVLLDVVSWSTGDPTVVDAATGLLPLVVLVILADGVQAVLGFGLVGMKRTTPSFLVFAVSYGVLALVAIPISTHAGLQGLWLALAVANLFVAIGQGLAFRHCSRNWSAPLPATVP